MNKEVSIHVPEPLSGIDIHPAFHFLSPPEKRHDLLFQDRVTPSYFTTVPRVHPESADAIVIAHNFKRYDERIAGYIKKYADLAEQIGKPLFIFSCGDFADANVFDPRAYVFRYSVYRSTMKTQDIVMPTVTEDHGSESVQIRGLQNRPTVSFCGAAGFSKPKQWFKYYIKNALSDINSLSNPGARARKIGIYWRRRMIVACEKSTLVISNFIIRKSFSANRTTISLDPEQARREYIDSLIHTDFVLAPKGDGNYSNRFLEALSYGRIPVLLDTESVLPFEDEIDYSTVIVRVSIDEVVHTPDRIAAWYDKLSQDEWHSRQLRARELYETRLRQDAFLRHLFTNHLDNYRQHIAIKPQGMVTHTPQNA